MNLKLCSKQYNRIDILHWIVVPQLSGGWQHKYSIKTRQAGWANKQSMYSLTAMFKNKAIRTKTVRYKGIRALVVRTNFLELKTSEKDVRTILVRTKVAGTKLFAKGR